MRVRPLKKKISQKMRVRPLKKKFQKMRVRPLKKKNFKKCGFAQYFWKKMNTTASAKKCGFVH